MKYVGINKWEARVTSSSNPDLIGTVTTSHIDERKAIELLFDVIKKSKRVKIHTPTHYVKLYQSVQSIGVKSKINITVRWEKKTPYSTTVSYKYYKMVI